MSASVGQRRTRIGSSPAYPRASDRSRWLGTRPSAKPPRPSKRYPSAAIAEAISRHSDCAYGPQNTWSSGNESADASIARATICLLYTSDAADDLLCVDLGGRRIIKKKK